MSTYVFHIQGVRKRLQQRQVREQTQLIFFFPWSNVTCGLAAHYRNKYEIYDSSTENTGAKLCRHFYNKISKENKVSPLIS